MTDKAVQDPYFFLSNQEEFWLGVADVYTLHLGQDGYWWPHGHPTWGNFVTQLICPPPIVANLMSKGLLHGIVSARVPICEREQHIERIKRRDEAGKAKFKDEPADVDSVWPTALGLKWSKRINWQELSVAMAQECFTLFKRVV